MTAENLSLFDTGVRFGPDFLRDHAGQIIGDPRTAVVELIANSYDAGAGVVRITWPNEKGDPLQIEDNGTGMTYDEFNRRWRTLTYKRTVEQGMFAEWPSDAVRKHQRVAFGQNGKGRHGAFCFADIYHVETWKNGELTIARIELTAGGSEPFQVSIETRGLREGHGTLIRAFATRKLLDRQELREAVGTKFLVDPSFTIVIDNEQLNLFELGNVTTSTVAVPGHGEVKVHLIDASVKDRTTHLKGVTWWVNGRMVGEPSWGGLTEEGAVLDGRTVAAKTYSFVIEADLLKEEVKPDWSGFHASARRNAVADAVQKHVIDTLHRLLATTRKERKKQVLEQNKTAVKDLPRLSQHIIGTFIDDIQQQCPSMSEADLTRAVGVFAKMEKARSGFELLARLEHCSPDEIDKWNQIMGEWTALTAELVLSELQKRLALIEKLQNLVHSSKTDELHDLQPLFEKGLWIFGPEYEAVDFRSNRGMTEIIRKFLKASPETTLSKRRIDFITLPDATIGTYSADAYGTDGEVAGLRKVLILELKKGGFDLMQKEMDQGRDYAKELRLAGAVQNDTEVVVYVLGASIQPGVEPAIIGGHTRVEPITYDVVLNRAHARTFNLQRKLQLIAETLPADAEVQEMLQSDGQSELFVPNGTSDAT